MAPRVIASHLSKLTGSSSRNRASLRRVRWKRETGCWDYGILQDASIGRKRKKRKEYCKRFLSGIEVTRVKNRARKRWITEGREKNYSNSSSWDPPERSDDLAAIFTVREKRQVRDRVRLPRCLKIWDTSVTAVAGTANAWIDRALRGLEKGRLEFGGAQQVDRRFSESVSRKVSSISRDARRRVTRMVSDYRHTRRCTRGWECHYEALFNGVQREKLGKSSLGLSRSAVCTD